VLFPQRREGHKEVLFPQRREGHKAVKAIKIVFKKKVKILMNI
jgi:hypothetical protein